MISERLSRVEESATLRITDLASKLRREGKDVISLSVGEPDFPTPEHIVEAGYKAMANGLTHYTPSKGIPELREAIARKFERENNVSYDPDQIIVTPGAKHAIFEAVFSLIEEGDEVILFEPAWVTYEACVKLSGGRVVWFNLGKGLEIDGIQEVITRKTKMIIVNSPNNPLGAVFDHEFMRTIRDVAVDHDLYVISDEIYEKIIYGGEHISPASMDEMWDRTITVNGFSKAYAMTGWRLGYAASSDEIISAMLKVQQHTVSCAPSFVQYAGVSALESSQKCVEDMVREFRERRDLVVSGLEELGIECMPAEGAFYVFADVGRYGSGMEVSERLLTRAYVAVTPGDAFGKSWGDWVRISYATSKENLRKALKRMREVLN